MQDLSPFALTTRIPAKVAQPSLHPFSRTWASAPPEASKPPALCSDSSDSAPTPNQNRLLTFTLYQAFQCAMQLYLQVQIIFLVL